MNNSRQELKNIENHPIENEKVSTNYYKNLSKSQLEACSSLAEQLICLRNDLDKTHVENIKIQKMHNRSLDSPNLSLRSETPLCESDRSSECPMPLNIMPKPIALNSELNNKNISKKHPPRSSLGSITNQNRPPSQQRSTRKI